MRQTLQMETDTPQTDTARYVKADPLPDSADDF